MPGMDGKVILETAIKELVREKERFQNLIFSGENGPFGDKSGAIKNKFNRPLSSIDKKLNEVINAKDEDRLADAWRGYVELKRHLLPRLSSDLLSVLGGVYARSKDLDNICEVDQNIPDTLSFARQAEALIEDLGDRSDWVWNSVLIVGEERYDDSEAEIIRLRYPACDLWNLPFTAHEYGYLVADRKPPGMFKDLLLYVQEQVKPEVRELVRREKQKEQAPAATDSQQSLPDDKCFLPQVRSLWERYRSKTGVEERKNFLQEIQSDVTELQKCQVAHLRRLFADAFATFFIGPAYIYTLLQFHFTPDVSLDHPTAEMPAFTQRFVFALETLKWMNSEPLVSVKPFPFNREYFEDEMKQPKGIFMTMWEAALQSSGNLPNRYREVAEDFKEWLKNIHRAFEKDTQYNSTLGIANTYQRWIAAEGLESELEKTGLNIIKVSRDEFPDNILCSVLNAAWSARWENPDKLESIEGNALKLLLGKIEIQIVEEASLLRVKRDRVVGPESAVAQKQGYLDEISKALAKAREFDLKKRFEEMVTQGKDQSIDAVLGKEILERIYMYEGALDAYAILWPKK